MNRLQLLKTMTTGAIASFVPYPLLFANNDRLKSSNVFSLIDKPVSVYISWASHDQLSDNVPLTEELAMREFDALLQLRKQGVQFDYYLMDMFWFDKNTGFRSFDKTNWKNGPDRWLNTCKENGIKPGLWISTNIAGWNDDPWMIPVKEWENSRGGWKNLAMSLHSGGFLQWHIDTLQQWYDRGVRMFKFDFANFEADTPENELVLTKDEIRQLNQDAWFYALKSFKCKNPDVMLLAYNGYGGDSGNTFPKFNKTVQFRWLEVFDSLYCGDPRPADVPCMNFWRSKDIYSDHMVFQYQYNGIPLNRIDNTSFMIGTTGTCYFRKKQAWKGMLVLSCARGGWMNTYYGNMDLLTDEDGKWFAKVQKMFYNLQEYSHFSTFGAIPGSAQPYGFMAHNQSGALFTVVNPSQKILSIDLPKNQFIGSKLLFHDAGYMPVLEGQKLSLGAEQMALIGFGEYANDKYYLGIQEDVFIPNHIEKLDFKVEITGHNKAKATFIYTGDKDIRLIFWQTDAEGQPIRISGGSPPNGISVGTLNVLKVQQNKKELPLVINFDKQIWSGLSWVVAEIKNKDIVRGKPIDLFYSVESEKKCVIRGELYEVSY